jgi:hypothetical protein
MNTTKNQQNGRVLAMQQVIKKLRNDNLNQGHCFMIFDDGLPEGQAYYEYPGGDIRIEQLNENNLDIPRIVIKVLTKKEVAALKEKHEVFQ